MIKITLDTNVLPAEDLLAAASEFDCDFAVVSVTEREVDGTPFEVHLQPFGRVHENGVYSEARYGQAVYASEALAETLDKILDVLSSGSFPRSPANLSHGQRRQFRDALILEAHIREGRNIFVTNDERGFIRDGRREKLEALFPVRILTRAEFSNACAAGSLWPLPNKRQSSSAASGQ